MRLVRSAVTVDITSEIGTMEPAERNARLMVITSDMWLVWNMGAVTGRKKRRGKNMKIKKITYQNRRDFKAIYECEHCGAVTEEKWGYDDANFHQNVIPDMVCEVCGKKADESYRPLATKYPEWMEV